MLGDIGDAIYQITYLVIVQIHSEENFVWIWQTKLLQTTAAVASPLHGLDVRSPLLRAAETEEGKEEHGDLALT